MGTHTSGRTRLRRQGERERERLVKGIMMKRGSASLLLLFVVLVLFSLSGQPEARRFRGNRGRGAVVAARSEVPLSIITETKCDKANGVKTATRSSSTGNGRTYNAIQTQVSTSLLQSGGVGSNASSEERVAMRVETPTTEFIFNIGPTLGNIGISEMAIQEEEEEEEGYYLDDRDEEDILGDAIRQPSPSQDLFTVKRIMIENGLTFNQVSDNETDTYALMNVTITSPIFNFTYGGLSDGTSHYTTCSLLRGKNASEVRIKAAPVTTSATVSPNLAFHTAQERSDFYEGLCSKSEPLGLPSRFVESSSMESESESESEVKSSIYLSLVSPQGELSLVRASNLFSMTFPSEWIEEFQAKDQNMNMDMDMDMDINPECTQRYCVQGDTSCLSNLEI